MFLTTDALAEQGDFALTPDPGLPQIVAGTDGTYYGKYDPGLPLLASRFIWRVSRSRPRTARTATARRRWPCCSCPRWRRREP